MKKASFLRLDTVLHLDLYIDPNAVIELNCWIWIYVYLDPDENKDSNEIISDAHNHLKRAIEHILI